MCHFIWFTVLDLALFREAYVINALFLIATSKSEQILVLKFKMNFLCW